MTEKDQVSRILRLAGRETLDYLTTLRPADTRVPSPIPDWTAGALLDHLLEVDDKILEAVAPLAAGSSETHRATLSLPATGVVSRYRRSGQRLVEALACIPAERLTEPVLVRGLGRLPAGVSFRLRPFEQFNHTNDIARALGHANDHLPGLVEPALQFVRHAAPWLVSPEHAGDIHLRIGFDFGQTGPGRWLLEVRGGVIRIDPWGHEPADASVGGDPAGFLLAAVLGKPPHRTAAMPRLDYRGDPAACQRLRRCFPILSSPGL